MNNKIYLSYDIREEGGEPESNERFCSHSDRYINFSPLSLYINKPNYYCFYDEILIDFNPNANECYYAVVARYQTGSTFGVVYGEYSIIGVYKDTDDAITVKKEIEKDYQKHEKELRTLRLSIHSPHFSGESWKGYFERLQNVEIHTLNTKEE